jgi:hypothetical protein
MLTQESPARLQGIGIISLIFGLLGAFFYWWTPLGMVFSLTGLTMGLVGWLSGRMLSKPKALVVIAVVVCTAAFALDLVIAVQGWELIKLTSYD